MKAQNTANRERDESGAFKNRHGKSKTKIHRTWRAMLNRCQNVNGDDYANYGGRGIRVCDRWSVFENFLADVGEPPSAKHSIDRIHNNGNYEPGNVRWATKKEQNNNKRDNQFIEWNGETRSRQEWATRIGINYRTLVTRLHRGWSIERALSHGMVA